jgi:hypothetical protein
VEYSQISAAIARVYWKGTYKDTSTVIHDIGEAFTFRARHAFARERRRHKARGTGQFAIFIAQAYRKDSVVIRHALENAGKSKQIAISKGSAHRPLNGRVDKAGAGFDIRAGPLLDE